MNAAYAKLLGEFARVIGLVAVDDFIASEELLIDELSVGFSLRRSADGPEIWCFTFLGTVAPDGQPEIYRALLQANDYWAGTGGATVSLQPGTGKVRLCMRITMATTNAQALALSVDRFVWAARMLQDELLRHRVEPVQPQPDFRQLA